MTADLFELGYAPENNLTIGKWAYEYVRLRDSLFEDNRFIIEETPWLTPVLETLLNGTLQEIVLMCCAQGGKTVSMLIALCWALSQRPGNTLFVAQTIDALKDIVKQKIIPVLESVPDLAAQLPSGNRRHLRSNRQIIFPNATLFMGPANDTFLREKTARWGFGDECSSWDPGAMDKFRARFTRIWNRKMFFASTPLDARSDFEKAFLEGDQQRFHLPTPCCGEMVYLTSANLEKIFQWPTDETTKPNGQWNYDAVRASVRLVCPKCGQKHEQTKDIYRKMIQGGRYIAGNPNASKETASFAFNVFCLSPDVMSWGKVVELWLKAKEEEIKGNLAPLKEFVTLRLAEAWDERAFLSYSVPNFLEYNPTEEWPEEMFRAMTVDCQEHLAEFHVVIRAWSKAGTSRLLDYATVNTEAELVALQEQWKIKPHLVGADCAYERYRVYDMCHRHGWTAMCGDDRKDWLHLLEDNSGRKVHRPFYITRGDPRTGKNYAGRTWCALVNWSNPTIKELLWALKEGKGASWAVCELGPERGEKYSKQLDSERKKEVIDRFGRIVMQWRKIRANHVWDCECMQVVFACLAMVFKFGDESIPDPAKSAAVDSAAKV